MGDHREVIIEDKRQDRIRVAVDEEIVAQFIANPRRAVRCAQNGGFWGEADVDGEVGERTLREVDSVGVIEVIFTPDDPLGDEVGDGGREGD